MQCTKTTSFVYSCSERQSQAIQPYFGSQDNASHQEQRQAALFYSSSSLVLQESSTARQHTLELPLGAKLSADNWILIKRNYLAMVQAHLYCHVSE